MELVPVIAIGAVGAVGFCLMLTAFVMVGRRGGWQQAMKPDARGHWPAPRLLMLIGALLGVVFALLLFIPGVIPWWDYSSPYRTWGDGRGLRNHRRLRCD
jgi:multisubunit Na+/H+ antiporter MnhB subunit